MIETLILRSGGVEAAKRIVESISQSVELSRWSNDRLQRNYANRSAMQIFGEGDAFYMNPCLDVALASLALAKESGIKGTLIIEKYVRAAGLNFNKLHFAVELGYGPNMIHIDPKPNGVIEVSRGRYIGRQEMKRLGLERISGEMINSTLPLHESLTCANREDLKKEIFEGYSLASHLQLMQKSNTEENFMSYCQRHGNRLKVIAP